MNITPARTEDLADLAELIAEYQNLDETSETIPDDETTREFLRKLLTGDGHSALFIGRTSSGELIGFVHIYCVPSALDSCRVVRITDLFIHPDYRRQGFGRQLFDHALRWARSQKHPRVVWFVENLNLEAQYMFDRVAGAAQTGWLGYSLLLSGHKDGL
ncbi:MAG TPA: GNAT family N-acetyltransferase [bacterium]|jgi:GNAT superfamily N-acetyltransferase